MLTHSLANCAAVVVASTVALALTLFGAFYVVVFPGWLLWAPFVSPTFYSFSIISASQLTGDELFACDPAASAFSSCREGAAFITGIQILRARRLTMLADIYVIHLFGFLIGFRLLGYLLTLFVGR